MYSASPRHGFSKPSPRKAQVADGPIKAFVQVLEDTKPEQWQKRTKALNELMSQIPSGHKYSEREAWYNSPPTLRHLHQPLGALLTDARSTVVKRTCEAVAELFAKCQSDAKYLFKDLMPIVLNVHAQTVQVIRNQVQTMVLDAIPVVPCKMAMPIWLDRLKTDKSRTVREACVLYLGMALKHWTSESNNNGEMGPGYLSEENWLQIGTALIKTLRDPSPTVRAHAKVGIETIRDSQPELWDNLIRDPDGPAGKDYKLQKWLIKVSESGDDTMLAANDELSVASRYSSYSYASRKGPGTPSANRGGNFRSTSRGRAAAVPGQIEVGDGTSTGGGSASTSTEEAAKQQRRGLGPPLRRPFAQAGVTDSPQQSYNPQQAGGYQLPAQLGTPPRPPSSPKGGSPSSPRSRGYVPNRSRSGGSSGPGSVASSPNVMGDRGRRMEDSDETRSANAGSGGAKGGASSNNRLKPTPELRVETGNTMLDSVSRSMDQTFSHLELPDTSKPRPGLEPPAPPEVDEGPFIASMNELRQHASKRKSRRSLLMQERWSRSNSVASGGLDDGASKEANTSGMVDNTSLITEDDALEASTPLPASTPATPSQLPEHFVIAEQLLRAHKTHVDQIMETLKIEMDTLRDFEHSLEVDKQPTPDEVLDYFEAVGLCLDQRTTAGNVLQREMDRISKGATQSTASNASTAGMNGAR